MKQELRSKIEEFRQISNIIQNVPALVDQVVRDNQDDIVSLNKDQLLLGRDSEGNVLGPSYLEDPYFKSREAAESYARFKYSLEGQHRGLIWNPVYLYPEKDRNTPNLIVTGLFQDHMYITVGAGSYVIESTYTDSSDINSKYKGKVFGLAPKSREFFFLEYIKPELIKHLRL